MSLRDALHDFATALGARQVLLFDGDGQDVLALHAPLQPEDLGSLRAALNSLVVEEERRAPPFTLGLPSPPMVAAALGVANLYVVAILDPAYADASRASVALPSLCASIDRSQNDFVVEAAVQRPHLGLQWQPHKN